VGSPPPPDGIRPTASGPAACCPTDEDPARRRRPTASARRHPPDGIRPAASGPDGIRSLRRGSGNRSIPPFPGRTPTTVRKCNDSPVSGSRERAKAAGATRQLSVPGRDPAGRAGRRPDAGTMARSIRRRGLAVSAQRRSLRRPAEDRSSARRDPIVRPAERTSAQRKSHRRPAENRTYARRDPSLRPAENRTYARRDIPPPSDGISHRPPGGKSRLRPADKPGISEESRSARYASRVIVTLTCRWLLNGPA
jgi:hypothetical protein